MAILILLPVLSVLLMATWLRPMRRAAAPSARPLHPTAGGVPVPAASARPCPACGGSGFVTRMTPKMESRLETRTEFHIDAMGHRGSRLVTLPRMVSTMQPERVACPACGGSGRVH